jgi:hypothetical protein
MPRGGFADPARKTPSLVYFLSGFEAKTNLNMAAEPWIIDCRCDWTSTTQGWQPG